jgi:hypothetical protein
MRPRIRWDQFELAARRVMQSYRSKIQTFDSDLTVRLHPPHSRGDDNLPDEDTKALEESKNSGSAISEVALAVGYFVLICALGQVPLTLPRLAQGLSFSQIELALAPSHAKTDNEKNEKKGRQQLPEE